MAARDHDGRHHRAVHQSAVQPALLRRLHAAQHRILLPAHLLHAAVHVPDLSGKRAGGPPTASPGTTRVLFVATVGSALYLMFNVRKSAVLGWEFTGAPTPVVAAGFVMWAMLMEALRRTGGWSLLLSVFPFTVYPLFAEQCLARSAARPAIDARSGRRLSHAVGGEPAGHSDPGLRRYGHRLPRVRHGADDDGCRQVLHQSGVRDLRHVPRRRGQGRHLRERICSA